LLNFVPWLFGHIPFLASQANAPWVEMLAAIVVPTIGLLIVVLLPWLDRSTTRSFASRGTVLWSTFIVIAAIVALTFYAQLGIQAKEAAGPPSMSEEQILAAPAEAATTTSTSGGASAAGAAGAKVFSQNCTSCHGTNGQGQAGVAPPLAGNPFVTGDPNAVITIVENGLHGQTIMGQTYGAAMPPWKGTLSKSDLAAVITYIRGGLGGNKASAVTESQIK
jgi:mono/diheme cytochrome c family protein